MIEYIYEEYNKSIKKKFKLTIKNAAVIFVCLCVAALSIYLISIKKDLAGIVVAIIFDLLSYFKSSDSDNCSILEDNYVKSKKLYEIINNKINVTSKSIDELIIACNYKIDQSKPKNNILESVKIFITSIVMPFSICVISVYYGKGVENPKIFFNDVSSLFVVIMLLYGVYIIIDKMFLHIENKEYNGYLMLRNQLQDIKIDCYSKTPIIK